MEDAICLAKIALDNPDYSQTDATAKSLDWSPSRMNAALELAQAEGAIVLRKVICPPPYRACGFARTTTTGDFIKKATRL
jgi:hypothetical protein